MENNLQGTFTEIISRLKILITAPMTVTKSEVLLFYKLDQDFPEEYHHIGSPGYSGYARH